MVPNVHGSYRLINSVSSLLQAAYSTNALWNVMCKRKCTLFVNSGIFTLLHLCRISYGFCTHTIQCAFSVSSYSTVNKPLFEAKVLNLIVYKLNLSSIVFPLIKNCSGRT